MKNYIILSFFFTLILYSDIRFGLEFKPLDIWQKKNDNFYYSFDGSSLSIQSEDSTIGLDKYTDELVNNFKKKYKGFKVLEREKHIKGKKYVQLKGIFFYILKDTEIKINFYMIIFNFYEKKAVFIFSYPDNTKEVIVKEIKNLIKSVRFVDFEKKINLNFHQNEKDGYGFLLPSNYKIVKNGYFIDSGGDFINIVKNNFEGSIKEYRDLYLSELNKKYFGVNLKDIEKERINGFEVVILKIKYSGKDIVSIIYKKGDIIYVVSMSVNGFYEKVKNSFQSLKKF